MKRSTFTHFALAAIAASFLFTTTASAQNARTVRQVNYGSGLFFQDSPTTWREEAGSSGNFQYMEVDRTERAVFLYDASRRVNVVLDMFQRKILNGSSLQSLPLYDMTADTTRINGRIVRLIRYMDKRGVVLGGFTQQADRKWVEFGGGAAHTVNYTFTEAGRDDWSVYLHDASRNAYVQIDLHTRKVIYSDPTVSRLPLYDVAFAE